MATNIETLMCSIDKDIKLTNDDEKLLSDLTESFLANQIDEIKNVKINNVYKNVNRMLISICDKIVNKFNIDKDLMNSLIESELCSINLRYNNEKQGNIKTEINNESNKINEDAEDAEDDEDSEDDKNNEEEKEVDCKTCQVFIEKKGQVCGRLKKAGTNYCGYHKKYCE
tara:strand:+ start:117 stop:626 length:510 start_codon:yes stop_codon:yes gene_type:complete